MCKMCYIFWRVENQETAILVLIVGYQKGHVAVEWHLKSGPCEPGHSLTNETEMFLAVHDEFLCILVTFYEDDMWSFHQDNPNMLRISPSISSISTSRLIQKQYKPNLKPWRGEGDATIIISCLQATTGSWKGGGRREGAGRLQFLIMDVLSWAWPVAIYQGKDEGWASLFLFCQP